MGDREIFLEISGYFASRLPEALEELGLALETGNMAEATRYAHSMKSNCSAMGADCLHEQGALFFDELVDAAHLLETELEDALAELVARGQVSCDSFTGLRALLLPASKRPASYARNGRRASLTGIADAGRWSLVRKPAPAPAVDPAAIEHIARVLLRRYGVVCWRLLEREASWLPPWRELLREYQRL